MEEIERKKSRKPWVAAIISLILGPLIGFAYINRGRWAVTYIFISVAVLIIILSLSHIGIISAGIDYFPFIFLLTVHSIGAMHCLWIAQQQTIIEPRKWYSRRLYLFIIFIFPILFSELFRIFFYEAFFIPSGSMRPTVTTGDHLMANKFVYRTSSPKRGDVVIFRLDDVNYIMRIIGVPGDRIQIKDSFVYINNEFVPRNLETDSEFQHLEIEMDYIHYIEVLPNEVTYGILDNPSRGRFDNTPVYSIPNRHYFALGDNRDNSYDSRVVGLIPEQDIFAKASIIFWNDVIRKMKIKPIH